jgi:hypothetical protein
MLAFRRGLAENGFFEGQNISFEFRAGHGPQLGELADELLSRNPAVMVAVAGPGSTPRRYWNLELEPIVPKRHVLLTVCDDYTPS